ncbi:MAG TPA: DUF3090 domain-containing protein [Lapillicoccus sp.]|jgi:uncharacterized repeat protein (TIGR03847 family)|nr:DUF3090 domain-containing protein [Lapillicoccus sp.]
MPVHDFDPPDRFVVGTVGSPGQRVFFLQALSGRRVVSVSCEKEQVAILAERVDDVLDQFAGEAAVAGPEDNEPLATPIEDEFRVATLSLAWDPNRAVIVIEAFDADIPDTEEEWGSGEGEGEESAEVPEAFLESMASRQSVRVVLSPPQARSFVRRARALVSAGRPPCPFCGGPLDPTGHVCPRANGYKR